MVFHFIQPCTDLGVNPHSMANYRVAEFIIYLCC